MGLLNLGYVFIGIDPGAQGAIAYLDKTSNVIRVDDWNGDEITMAAGIRGFMVKHAAEYHAAIEYASSMPGQGVSSVFKYGTNYGIWRGILAANRIPFEIVHPTRWKNHMIKNKQDGGKKKAAEIATALRLWPGMAPGIVGPRGGAKDGRAEALLIAEYCRRKTLGVGE